MSKVVKSTTKLWMRENPDGKIFLIWCPACACGHTIPFPRWGFNGNLNFPTFTPSVRHYYNHPATQEMITTCHYNVTDGKIVYHDDNPHEFKGRTIEMEAIPQEYGF